CPGLKSKGRSAWPAPGYGCREPDGALTISGWPGNTALMATGFSLTAWNSALLAVDSWSRENSDRKSTRLNSSHVKISYAVFCFPPPTPSSSLLPYPTLFRSLSWPEIKGEIRLAGAGLRVPGTGWRLDDLWLAGEYCLDGDGFLIDRLEFGAFGGRFLVTGKLRSEEHTSELQSRENLVCRLLLSPANT